MLDKCYSTPEFKTKGILFVGMRDTVHTVLALLEVYSRTSHIERRKE